MPGRWKEWKTKRQVFHSSHCPLEISPTPRDFHIPTAQAGRAWKSGKPKSGFPLSPTRPATMTTIPFKTSKSKPNLAASGGQKRNQRRRASRRKVSSPYARFPGSPRIGNESPFQAHSALETNIDFRLTFGLENAGAAPAISSRAFGDVGYALLVVALEAAALHSSQADFSKSRSNFSALAFISGLALP